MAHIGELPQDTTVQDNGYIIYSEDGVHLYKMTRADFLKNLTGFGLKYWKEDTNVIFRAIFNGAKSVSKQYVNQAYIDYGGNSNYIFYGGRTKGSSTNKAPTDMPFYVTSDGVVHAKGFEGSGGELSQIDIEPTMTQGLEVAQVVIDGEVKTIYAPEITPIYNEGTQIANVEIDGVTVPIYCPVIDGALEDMATYDNEIEVQNRTHIGTFSTPNGDYELYTPTPTTVTVIQTLQTGTEVGSVNGTKLYAPTPETVEVEQTIQSGTKIGSINHTDLYCPEGATYSIESLYTASSSDFSPQTVTINDHGLDDFDLFLIYTSWASTSSSFSKYTYPMPYMINKDAIDDEIQGVTTQLFTLPGYNTDSTMTIRISGNSSTISITIPDAGSQRTSIRAVYGIKF